MASITETKPLLKASLLSPLPERDQCDEEGYILSDGKPMAETREHMEAMIYAIFALRTRFLNQPDVYVMGNDFLHFRKDNRTAYLSPDCSVVFGGTPKPSRPNFKIWEEGVTPLVIFEMTSTGTRHEDERKKYEIYRDLLKVSEYYRFDSKGEYLKPRLRGDSLVEGEYRPMPLNINGRIFSPALNLEIGLIGEELRFYLPDTGLPLLSPQEEQIRADSEQVRADSAERQLEIERDFASAALNRERELARAEQDRLKEEASVERKRAELAESEMAQLRAQIAALQPK